MFSVNSYDTATKKKREGKQKIPRCKIVIENKNILKRPCLYSQPFITLQVLETFVLLEKLHMHLACCHFPNVEVVYSKKKRKFLP